MTNELQTRLRAIADRWGGGPVYAELVEAADALDAKDAEIEELRTENERLLASLRRSNPRGGF